MLRRGPYCPPVPTWTKTKLFLIPNWNSGTPRMQSKMNLQRGPMTISSPERVLKVMSLNIRNLTFRSECPWQPPTLPLVFPPPKRVRLPRPSGVANQLQISDPERSRQIR